MPIKTLLLLEKARMTNAVHEDEWPIWGVGGKSPHYLEAFSGFPYGKHGRKPRPLVGVLHEVGD